MRAYTLVIAFAAMVAAAACGDSTERLEVCGDGIVGGTESCDDGSANGTAGDPCNASCNFTCTTDTECGDSNACNGTETCTNHVCKAGTVPAEGASCGTGMVCHASTCTSITCGDGKVDTGEECDDGAKNGTAGDPCNATCHFSCKADTDCSNNNACDGAEVCTNHVCGAGTPPAEGSGCGTGKACHSNVCASIMCGDGTVDAGEECDDKNSVNGDGCDACRFSCVSSDATRNCALSDECQGVSTCNDTTHVCSTPTKLPDNTPCAGGAKFCLSGVCTTSGCGNGIREPGEQCDDGNALNLDGCDSSCQFEQAARVTQLKQQFSHDASCQKNVLGEAFTEVIQSTLQDVNWDQPVGDGRQNIVFKFLGLTDLTGTSGQFSLGFVDAKPVECSSPNCYNGHNDLDWWYVRTPASVDANEDPLVKLPGQITNGHVKAGPGTISLNLLFGLEPTQITLHNAVVDTDLNGPVNTPRVSQNGRPPGHLASENLLPTLTSFSSSTTGSMCSDVSAASFFNKSMPALVLTIFNCLLPDASTPTFSSSNRLLDLFVAGCVTFDPSDDTHTPVPVVTPTQPDGSLDGATYQFIINDSSNTVTGCTRNGAPGDLPECLNQATFSSYFKLESDRVIIKRN